MGQVSGATVIIITLVALLAGTAVGFRWGRRHWTAPADRIALENRLASASRRAETAEGEGRNLLGQARDLQRVYNLERSLLDGVAESAEVEPAAFRRALAEQRIYADDDERLEFLAEVDRAEERAPFLATMALGAASEHPDNGGGDRQELARLRHELRQRDRELSDAWKEAQFLAAELAETEQRLDATTARLDRTEVQFRGTQGAIIDLRDEVETLIASAGPPAGDRHEQVESELGQLRGEIAELRARLADRAIGQDRLRSLIRRRARLDGMLAQIRQELDRIEPWKDHPGRRRA